VQQPYTDSECRNTNPVHKTNPSMSNSGLMSTPTTELNRAPSLIYDKIAFEEDFSG